MPRTGDSTGHNPDGPLDAQLGPLGLGDRSPSSPSTTPSMPHTGDRAGSNPLQISMPRTGDRTGYNPPTTPSRMQFDHNQRLGRAKSTIGSGRLGRRKPRGRGDAAALTDASQRPAAGKPRASPPSQPPHLKTPSQPPHLKTRQAPRSSTRRAETDPHTVALSGGKRPRSRRLHATVRRRRGRQRGRGNGRPPHAPGRRGRRHSRGAQQQPRTNALVSSRPQSSTHPHPRDPHTADQLPRRHQPRHTELHVVTTPSVPASLCTARGGLDTPPPSGGACTRARRPARKADQSSRRQTASSQQNRATARQTCAKQQHRTPQNHQAS